MKLDTLCGHLVPLLDVPMSELTELRRALKEQSAHFNPEEKIKPDVLVRAKEGGVAFDMFLLKGKAGPGGGVEATPFIAAFFLLAVAINGPRKESASATWLTWHLNQAGSELSGWGDDWKPTVTCCPLTEMHLFGEALRKIVEDADLAARVQEVRVSSDLAAEIYFDNGQVSKFEKPHPDRAPRLHRLAVIDGLVWKIVAELVNREG